MTRTWPPLKAGHPMIGKPCARCGRLLQEGDETQAVDPTPAGEGDAAKAASGRAHTVKVQVAHVSCPDPDVQTFWHGVPTRAFRCVVVVAGVEKLGGRYWAHALIGEEREAVEVHHGPEPFYLDDVGYDRTPEELALMESGAESLVIASAGRMTREQALEQLGAQLRTVGYPGWAWEKVTTGQGAPHLGHATLAIERVVRYIDEPGEAS